MFFSMTEEDTIDSIVETSAEKIKKILIEEWNKLTATPLLYCGKSESLMLSGPSIKVKHTAGLLIAGKIERNKAGVGYVIMTPEGLVYCRSAMFMDQHNHCVDRFPDLTTLEKRPSDYLVYGKIALNTILLTQISYEINHEDCEDGWAPLIMP